MMLWTKCITKCYAKTAYKSFKNSITFPKILVTAANIKVITLSIFVYAVGRWLKMVYQLFQTHRSRHTSIFRVSANPVTGRLVPWPQIHYTTVLSVVTVSLPGVVTRSKTQVYEINSAICLNARRQRGVHVIYIIILALPYTPVGISYMTVSFMWNKLNTCISLKKIGQTSLSGSRGLYPPFQQKSKDNQITSRCIHSYNRIHLHKMLYNTYAVLDNNTLIKK